MRTRLALTTGLAAAALLVLAGCTAGPGGTGGTGGTGSDGSSGSESGPGGSGDIGECLQGSWDLDEAALARDLAESMTSSGANVVESSASGGVHLRVDGDQMSYDSDVTYTMVIDMGDGLVMINNQLQVGESTGVWSIEDGRIVFSSWESGITITNDVTINGETASQTTELPGSEEGVPMEVTCDGDLLSTHPEASPYTSVWVRE